MDSYNNNVFGHSNQVSSDIESIINAPLSFSYCDDFFKEESPMVDYVPPVVEPLVNSSSYSDSKEAATVPSADSKHEPLQFDDIKIKSHKFDERGGSDKKASEKKQHKYMAYEIPNAMKYVPVDGNCADADLDRSEDGVDVNIFGEKCDDEDYILNYDVSRLYDIQREISVLAGAIQRYQATRSRVIKEESLQRSKEAEVLNKKRKIIDELVRDISDIYENLKVRESIISRREEFLMNMQKAEDEEPDDAGTPEGKVIVTEEPSKAADFRFESGNLGLNDFSIDAINDAMRSLK